MRREIETKKQLLLKTKRSWREATEEIENISYLFHRGAVPLLLTKRRR